MLGLVHITTVGLILSNSISTCRSLSLRRLGDYATSTIVGLMLTPFLSASAANDKLEYQPALQGLNYGKYKIVKDGQSGPMPKPGDRVVVDWEGYTIGYYGRPFQTRNKVKGGAFDSSDKDYFRWVVGSGNAVAALDEVVQKLHKGGVAQVIVPAELGYPQSGDPDHSIVGPKPTTFSGQRALNFVLDNQNLIDKTLLMNIRLVRVDTGFAAASKAGAWEYKALAAQ